MDRIFGITQSGKAKSGSVIDCRNCVVTSAFIDPLTHPVFTDMRRDEFDL
ncbi:MAG: hypothetical protein PHE86_06345 [Candidatus Marinimicrobia bacterium]|nr:hypothetical protein [Candidatus Neomarinimicrobiota bacterium]MDD5581834.1 hypothetical protein [Candidatus Neomarinimicrobiota bacterium]